MSATPAIRSLHLNENGSSGIYRRQMGAASGSEELVYDSSDDPIYGPIVVAPVDQTIYFPSYNTLQRYQQGAESPEDHMATTVSPSVLELMP